MQAGSGHQASVQSRPVPLSSVACAQVLQPGPQFLGCFLGQHSPAQSCSPGPGHELPVTQLFCPTGHTQKIAL